MYSSYTSILLVVVTHCCLHSRYQQAEIGRAGTSRHPALDKKLPEDCPTAEVLLEAKAAALHLERYQSSLSTEREGEAGKETQGNRIG
jgi:hypothetical protein